MISNNTLTLVHSPGEEETVVARQIGSGSSGGFEEGHADEVAVHCNTGGRTRLEPATFVNRTIGWGDRMANDKTRTKRAHRPERVT